MVDKRLTKQTVRKTATQRKRKSASSHSKLIIFTLTVGHGSNHITQSSFLVDSLPMDRHVVLDQHAGVLNSRPDDGDERSHGDARYRDDGEDGKFPKVSLERELEKIWRSTQSAINWERGPRGSNTTTTYQHGDDADDDGPNNLTSRLVRDVGQRDLPCQRMTRGQSDGFDHDPDPEDDAPNPTEHDPTRIGHVHASHITKLEIDIDPCGDVSETGEEDRGDDPTDEAETLKDGGEGEESESDRFCQTDETGLNPTHGSEIHVIVVPIHSGREGVESELVFLHDGGFTDVARVESFVTLVLSLFVGKRGVGGRHDRRVGAFQGLSFFGWGEDGGGG